MLLLNLNIRVLNKWLLCLFVFSIAFERAFPFLPGMSYPKFIGILYVTSLLCNPAYLRLLKQLQIPSIIFIFFLLFLFMNFLNGGIFEYGVGKIDTSFLLNIALVLFLLVHEKMEQYILPKSLIFFFFGYLFLVLAYYLGYYQVGIGGRVRIGAALPNSLAFFGVFAVCSSFILSSIYRNRSIFTKLFQVISILMIISLVLATGSRSAFISLVLVFGVFLFCSNTNRLGFVLLGVIFIPIFFLSSAILTERIAVTATEGDLGGRLAIILFVTELIYENPLWGIGKLQYDFLAEKYFGYSPSPHNVFLETYLYGGLAAFTAWLAILFKLLRTAFNQYKATGIFNSLILLPPILLMGVSGQIFNNSIVFLVIAVILSTNKHIKHAQ